MLGLLIGCTVLALILWSAYGYRKGYREGRRSKAGEIAAHAELRARRKA